MPKQYFLMNALFANPLLAQSTPRYEKSIPGLIILTPSSYSPMGSAFLLAK
ncbi:hypothetical protein LRP52_47445 [Photobacterium sp. ZSDE20]|uniref:Uncharacterized protein n=1 Tax=Photobacterium pectinilyticum TaxID=2906793 RepID=A0ABT1N989_9GAMM|nr:hypothetical protein [Photobacterium sp. ZSDE20]MCQ1061288.1 hypothetical protein [Photobacterium sp. ZSDE20]MDD1829789.1 hypothetical protein [Photobacterium sp. ZSDE20]